MFCIDREGLTSQCFSLKPPMFYTITAFFQIISVLLFVFKKTHHHSDYSPILFFVVNSSFKDHFVNLIIWDAQVKESAGNFVGAVCLYTS